MTVIVRRPHAYKFRQTYGKSPIPGLVVLDAEGNYLGGVTLPSKDAVTSVVEWLSQ